VLRSPILVEPVHRSPHGRMARNGNSSKRHQNEGRHHARFRGVLSPELLSLLRKLRHAVHKPGTRRLSFPRPPVEQQLPLVSARHCHSRRRSPGNPARGPSRSRAPLPARGGSGPGSLGGEQPRPAKRGRPGSPCQRPSRTLPAFLFNHTLKCTRWTLPTQPRGGRDTHRDTSSGWRISQS